MNVQVGDGQPKVHQVDHVVGLAAGQPQQKVLRLDIPVDEVHVVDVLDGIRDVGHKFPEFLLAHIPLLVDHVCVQIFLHERKNHVGGHQRAAVVIKRDG